jgi:hypothetical protein
MHSTLRLAAGVGVFVCVTGAAPAPVVAQTHTRVALDKPVRVPGAVIAPGVYKFSTLSDGGRGLALIQSDDGRFTRFVHVAQVHRARAGAIISLRPRPAGALAELAAWYPDGGTSGYEFAAKIAEPSDVSVSALANLDKRLAAADDAVTDARGQLNDAETSRNVIRALRGRAR